VGSLTVSVENASRGSKFGRAVVVVTDDLGQPVADAVVSGEFSGSFNEVVGASTPTDATGTTTIDTSGQDKGSVSITFCVTGISHPTLADFAPAPGDEVCSSS
jgi:uncharacterized GH25 family protein